MHLRTGEIADVSEILEEEKKDYVPLTKDQARRYKKMNPAGRLEAWRNEQRHIQKQIKKRREANKRKGK